MKYLTVPLIGPPGAGKTTVGRRLAFEFPHDFFYAASGDIVRSIMAEDSELGRTLKDLTARGQFTPDGLIKDMLLQYVDNKVRSNAYDPCRQILLLDGAPRTIAQVDLLSDILDVKEVYFCDASDALAKDRLLSRRLEDLAAGKQPRDDDNIAAIERRLSDYREHTLPVVQVYSGRGVPIRVFNMSGSRAQAYGLMMDHALEFTVLLLGEK